MKQETALKHLRLMMWCIQRFRANAMDPLFGPVVADGTPGLQLTESMVADMFPWIFGDKCPLEVLAKVIDGVEETGVLVPMDYYNFMFILDRFMPELRMVSVFYDRELPKDERLPDGPPNISILRGWD